MEGKEEVSDTDSGIILHSGPDSPTTILKDVTTHTRAMKLRQQSLEDRLELCLLELKKLCIREAELTGQLSADYPVLPGENPPQVRRRIGAAFKLDKQSLSHGAEDSELTSVEAKLALQLQILAAARRLCGEEQLSKAVRRSRLQQCRREERKVKELQEAQLQLRLEHGRASPRPACLGVQRDQGHSDDSSLSDSAVLDEEEVTSQSSQPSLEFLQQGPGESPQPPPGGSSQPPAPSPHPSLCPLTPQNPVPCSLTPHHPSPCQMTPQNPSPCSLTPQHLSPCLLTPSHPSPCLLTPSHPSPRPLTPQHTPLPSMEELHLSLSLSASVELDPPPIQHSPWSESSLDQPYQKPRKSRSGSTKSSSPALTPVLPPVEACLGDSPLPGKLSHLRLGHTQSNSAPWLGHAQSNSAPSTPEMQLRRQLSLRVPSTEACLEAERDRGRTRGHRRRLTDYVVMSSGYGNPLYSSSEDSSSEHSSAPSYSGSPCGEGPGQPVYRHPPLGPTHSHGPPPPSTPTGPAFYQNPRHQASPGFHRGYEEPDMGRGRGYEEGLDLGRGRSYYSQAAPCLSSRYDYWYEEAPAPARGLRPPQIRLSRTPSLRDYPPRPPRGVLHLPQQVVSQELWSWHQRNQAHPPRPRSLDRQGALRVRKHPGPGHAPSPRTSPRPQHCSFPQQVPQRVVLQRAADGTPVQWFGEDGSEIVSQV